ncbi:MAG: ribosome small subunit-dependent GTPase A, partial [Lentisphaeria bacterium]
MSWKHIVPKVKKVIVDHAVGKEGVIVGHYGVAVDIQFEDGSRDTVRVKRKSGHVVGDFVTVAPTGVIGQERLNELKRVDINGRERVVAANLDVLGVVVAPQPPTPPGFIDRVFVGAMAAGIEPFIVVNKCDMDGASELYDELEARYGWRFSVIMVSAEEEENLEELEEYFAQGIRGAFVGTSGVGKSTLLNMLCPDIELETCEINEEGGFGRHATTAATLNELPDGGELIDTPGFRDFRLADINSEDLAWYFPDFYKVFKDQSCRFHDCLHQAEPGCVITEAVNAKI